MRALPRLTDISLRLFLLFTLLFAFTTLVRADDDETADDEYEENARVARVNLVRGDVQLQRSGSQTWETARVNFALVEGDVLATTGQDARLEVQIDARNFVRVGGDSILRIVSLRDEGVALSLSEGTATLRLARFDRDKEYFEIDAPGTTLAAEKRGVYRLDVSREGRVRLTVRNGGQARIYSETSGFALRDGRSAELVAGGTDAGDWELAKAESFDSWDTWVDERERYLASRLNYEGRDRYYDSDVWGAEELDAYGDWTYSNDYGWVWRPHVTVINNYNDWAPYRYGQWTWIPPYGWTWVGDEPWGWAPYHYGRWIYYNNNWCWAPRGYGYTYRRAWWRPALVAFVYIPTSYGERVCWYPLSHGQRDPRGRHYRRLESLRANDVTRLQRTNPAFLRAITTLPARDFGRRAARAQQASTEIARRVFTAEPVRGRLPIAPTDGAGGQNAGDNNRRMPRDMGARPPRSNGDAAAALPDRPTGAARRTPGVALDGELRRTRLFNGREPRTAPSASESGGSGSGGGSLNRTETGDTGAVERPARRRSTNIQPTERVPQGGEGSPGTPATERPARPTRMNPDAERRQTPVFTPDAERPSGGEEAQPAPAPRARPRRDDNDERPAESRPSRREESRPEPRPERRDEPRPEPRFEPRSEPRPEPRPERQPENRPEPRSEPRPESRPEPRPESRPEPRPESRPEPRPEPPPQREEPRPEPRPEPSRPEPAPAPESRPEPRNEPPPRNDPPPQREERPAAPPPRDRDEGGERMRPSRPGRR